MVVFRFFAPAKYQHTTTGKLKKRFSFYQLFSKVNGFGIGFEIRQRAENENSFQIDVHETRQFKLKIYELSSQEKCMSTTIKCPNCRHEFAMEEAVSEQYKKDLREQMIEFTRKKEEEFQKKTRDLSKKLIEQ